MSEKEIQPDMRMRCHFSMIFESLWQFWLVIVVAGINEIDTIVEMVREIGEDGLMEMLRSGGIWGLLILLGITLIVLSFQYLRWRRTWVILQDNLIIVERNTLHKVKHTIAIENLSAVNMERNLFERIVGTYRVKMDTNSMTTANSTDVSLVFSAEKAIAFRRAILQKMGEIKGLTAEEALSQERQPDELICHAEETATDRMTFHYGIKAMLLHCVYSVSLTSLCLTVAGIGFFVWSIHAFGAGKIFAVMLSSGFAAVLVVLGAAWSLIQKFMTYYGFTVYRDGQDLHLRYGLLKQRSYTIPVDKIAALKLSQPVVSRLCGRYQAEVVTVGFGDEDGESANLTMALPKTVLLQQLSVLLPEYCREDLLDTLCRQDARLLRIRAVKLIKWTLLVGAATGVLIGLWALPTKWVCMGAVALILYVGMLYVVAYLTAGYRLEDDRAILAGGVFTRRIYVCMYAKMQYMQLHSHPLERRYQLVSGNVYLLNASAAVPCMHEAEAVWLARQIVTHR